MQISNIIVSALYLSLLKIAQYADPCCTPSLPNDSLLPASTAQANGLLKLSTIRNSYLKQCCNVFIGISAENIACDASSSLHVCADRRKLHHHAL
jgi:hypothetical protein